MSIQFATIIIGMEDPNSAKIIKVNEKGINDAQSHLAAGLGSTSCNEVKLDGEWYFTFENGAVLRVGCLWRLVVGGRVTLSSRDHSQMFGRRSPVDAAQEASAKLSGKQVTSIALADCTADIRLTFSDGIALEVLNDSSGYEPWGFSSKGVTLVATPSGAVFSI